MSRYVAVDLSSLPFPAIIGPLDFEAILASLKADLIALAPSLAPALEVEGDPVQAVLQTFAYRALILEARYNDVARAAFIATAVGADLDNLAALFGVARLVIAPADPDAVPPVAVVVETDDDLRARTQLAIEAFSCAGPRGAYEYHALTADPQVMAVGVTSPLPGRVQVVVLARDGAPSAAVLATVEAALNAEEVRPLTDEVRVLPAELVQIDVVAKVEVPSGPAGAEILEAARSSVAVYLDSVRRVGQPVRISALYAALHRPGVIAVNLLQPAADMMIDDTKAAWPGVVNLIGVPV